MKKYIITYQVMEGNNYAGGLVTHKRIVDDLEGHAWLLAQTVDKVEELEISSIRTVDHNEIQGIVERANERKHEESMRREKKRLRERLRQINNSQT